MTTNTDILPSLLPAEGASQDTYDSPPGGGEAFSETNTRCTMSQPTHQHTHNPTKMNEFDFCSHPQRTSTSSPHLLSIFTLYSIGSRHHMPRRSFSPFPHACSHSLRNRLYLRTSISSSRIVSPCFPPFVAMFLPSWPCFIP